MHALDKLCFHVIYKNRNSNSLIITIIIMIIIILMVMLSLDFGHNACVLTIACECF